VFFPGRVFAARQADWEAKVNTTSSSAPRIYAARVRTKDASTTKENRFNLAE
jgi:hypothetical protein